MDDTARTPDAGASNIPDSRGINFFTVDPDLGALLKLHLGDARYAGSSRNCARSAHACRANSTNGRRVQTSTRPCSSIATGAARPCSGSTRIPRMSRSNASHIPSRLRFAEPRIRLGAAARQVRADVPVRAGGIRAVLPGQHDRFADTHAAPFRRSGARRALPADACVTRLRHAVGRDVHDRAGGGFRRRPDHDAGDARDRRARRDPLAPDRRQVVLFERGRRAAMVLARPDGAPDGIKGLRCSCCRRRCRTARATATGSCA